MRDVSAKREGGGGRSAPFHYKSPRKEGVVVKALEGREERQGLDLRRWGLWWSVQCLVVCLTRFACLQWIAWGNDTHISASRHAPNVTYTGLLKAILHYVLGLHFGKVCEQNASKTRAKREQNASKTRAKREQNASKTRAKRKQNASKTRAKRD